jgi:hypothetical protein
MAGTNPISGGLPYEGTGTPKDSGEMTEIHSIETANARLRIKRAENSLKRANDLLDEDAGVALNLALCGRIRAAQRRLIEARARLTTIDPTRTN